MESSRVSRVVLLVRLEALNLGDGEKIKIKLTGDGTNIAKSIHVVNFAFTLFNEGSAANSPFGNHSLAIFQGPEDYNSLKTSLADIVKEASELRSIKVRGKEHEIEYFFGGDLKFLAIVCGIEAANAKYACVWCKCSNCDRWDMSKDWSAFDVSKGARTIDEIERCSKLSKARSFSCCEIPVFKFIPIDHVIIDTLHLFLRVADLLINLLIQELRRQDGIAKATLDRDKHSHVTSYESFLNTVCKIHFRWYTSQETKQMQWRDLTGPEKIRLFKNIDIPKLFPSLPNDAILQDIWTEFWRLFNELGKADTDPKELQEDIKIWVRNFLKVYQTKNITPYVHAFAFHVPEFMEAYGSICQFSQQGLEKLNDITTQHFLRGTNHHDVAALKQVMEKRNRIEELDDKGFKRSIRQQKCGVCGKLDHNRRTCPSRSVLGEISQDNSMTPS